jgi:hypothetical protein
MKNSNLKFLRSLILEQVEELFSDPGAEEEVTRLEKDSADDQIDSFILKFEKDSISSEDSETKSLNESLKNLSLRALLMEQAEDEEDVEDDPDAADEPADEPDAGEDAEEVEDPPPEDSSASDVEPAESLPKPPLNIDAFTKRVARLAMNHETLLDIKTVIVNRAMNFLLDNYDQEHVDEMREILDSQFDFDLDGGKEIPEAPYAVGAFQGGTGQMGGGAA